MNRFLLLLISFILMSCQAFATVEETSLEIGDASGSTWANPSNPSLPTYLPSPCQGESGILCVAAVLTGSGSEAEKSYTIQGKPLSYVVTVKNEGSTDANVDICIKPENCAMEWFSWMSTTINIPAGASRSENLQVEPDTNAVAGDYSFAIEASAKCRTTGIKNVKFKVQALDYASETMVSGSGQFQINKDVRSMNSGIKSTKNVVFSGSVDALMKNEYLVDQAKGKNANFEEQDAVDNYNAVDPGDALAGSENFRSSVVFGGVGAKVLESYDVQQMESKMQDFTLHQTGSLKKAAEFKTADNFTGEYMIDARQSIPGQRNMKENEYYNGSFEINRRILFRDATATKQACTEPDCVKTKATNIKSNYFPVFVSPCFSGSCNNFVNRLNTFTQ